MKLLVVLFTVFVCAYGLNEAKLKEMHQQAEEISKACMEQTGATQADYEQIKVKHQLPTTKNGKCMVACFHKTIGLQDKNGKIDVVGIPKVLEHFKELDEDIYTKMKKMADKCLDEVKDSPDECETATNIMGCCMRVSKELGMEDVFHG